jgi:hypothetical protein
VRGTQPPGRTSKPAERPNPGCHEPRPAPAGNLNGGHKAGAAGPARPRSASHPSAPDGGPSSAGTAAAGKGRTIALSDYEQRRLDEIQRALHRDDPGFADAINIGTEATARRTVAAPAFLVGLLVTVAGAVLAQVNH